MKKVLIVTLLILALCLSLAACKGNKSAEETTAPSTPAATNSTPPATNNTPAPTPTQQPAATESNPPEDPGEGGTIVNSTQSFEDIVRGYYYTCASMSDDGIVRDYWSQAPIEFSYSGEDVVWYGYKSNGEYRGVCISPNGVNPETGSVDYLIEWY